MLKKAGFSFCCILFVALLIIPQTTKAQFGDPFGMRSNEIKRSPIRKALNKVSLTASSGYGLTLYSHEIKDYTFLQKANGASYIIRDFRQADPNLGYSDWVQNPVPVSDIRVGNDDFFVNTDTASLKFRGLGNSIPVNLMLHVNISNLRLGGGVMFEFHTLSTFQPTEFYDEILPFEPASKTAMFRRFYGMIGYKVHDFWDYSFVPEVQFGKINMGRNFNNEAIDRGMYANIGVSIEKNFSEYFRLFIKPAVDFKNYTMVFPETTNIVHRQPAFFITAGISLNYPEVPRCKLKSCQTQLKHVHSAKEFRGQPIYKKQNPKYGENHKDLIKYKGKNKRIRSPF